MRSHLLVLFIVFVASCSKIPVGQETPGEYTVCTTDADCIPRPGCHPETCVNAEYEDAFETAEFCTLIYMCGTASTESCLCQNNRCVPILRKAILPVLKWSRFIPDIIRPSGRSPDLNAHVDRISLPSPKNYIVQDISWP